MMVYEYMSVLSVYLTMEQLNDFSFAPPDDKSFPKWYIKDEFAHGKNLLSLL